MVTVLFYITHTKQNFSAEDGLKLKYRNRQVQHQNQLYLPSVKPIKTVLFNHMNLK